MKKFYFLAMMAMLAFSTTSCQKDEFNDAPAKSTSTFTSFNTSSSSSSSSSSTSPFTNNKTVTTMTVKLDKVEGNAQGDETNLTDLALRTLRSFYKEQLGQEAQVTGFINQLTIDGKFNKAGAENVVKNISSAQLDEVFSKVPELTYVKLTVYKGSDVLTSYTYKVK